MPKDTKIGLRQQIIKSSEFYQEKWDERIYTATNDINSSICTFTVKTLPFFGKGENMSQITNLELRCYGSFNARTSNQKRKHNISAIFMIPVVDTDFPKFNLNYITEE